MSHATLLDALDNRRCVVGPHAALRATLSPTRAILPPATRPAAMISTGRGNLSEEALAEFTRFFLSTCLDQVTFMEGLMQPDSLRARILLWTEEEIRLDRLPPKSSAILEAVLYRGELPRGDAAGIVGTGDRQARRVVSPLIERGVLVSDSSRAPLRLAFPGNAGIAVDAGPVSPTDLRKSHGSKEGKKASEETGRAGNGGGIRATGPPADQHGMSPQNWGGARLGRAPDNRREFALTGNPWTMPWRASAGWPAVHGRNCPGRRCAG